MMRADMRDFLGQELKIGDFAAYPGAGNNAAEYGLILIRIVSMSFNSITAERLDPDYGQNGKGRIIKRKRINIKAITRLIKITPPSKMVEVFTNPDKHFDLVSKWIHGRTDINWETLEIGKMRN